MNAVHAMPFGAEVTASGVRFALWAPGAREVSLLLDGDRGRREFAVPARGGGWFEVTVADARAGARYRYRVDGELSIPDPAARFVPGDVHGDSEVVDPTAFAWTDDAWRGRPWHETVIYELHVGTFTPEGRYAAIEPRLPALVELGATALELMPLADFPGRRNWGYDGVLLFAPDATYGTPDELKHLVAAAHAHGLMVFLDVVYNHLGPEGNYLHRLAPPFFADRHTPWGAALNFDGTDSRSVRDFVVHNALFWIEEYRFDGLRLDAVHAIHDASDLHLLNELARAVADGPGRHRHVHLIVENDRNESHRLVRDGERRASTFTAQWNDDFHHVMHHLLTGERDGYYGDYAADPLAHLGRCLAEGFAYQGEPSAHRRQARRGEPSRSLPADALVNFLQNHDQVGNRAFGERLAALAPHAALRAAVGVLLLCPAIPLLFMGEEFGGATPFLYFCDLEPGLADAVRHGRRAEHDVLPRDDVDAAFPDPFDATAHARSMLDWASRSEPAHAEWLALYRELLALRARHVVPLLPSLSTATARHEVTMPGALAVAWPTDDGRTLHLEMRLPPARGRPLSPVATDAQVIWQYDPDDAAGWQVRFHIARTMP